MLRCLVFSVFYATWSCHQDASLPGLNSFMLPYPTFPCHVKRLHVLYIFSYYLSDLSVFMMVRFLIFSASCYAAWRFGASFIMLFCFILHQITLFCLILFCDDTLLGLLYLMLRGLSLPRHGLLLYVTEIMLHVWSYPPSATLLYQPEYLLFIGVF